jgi:hypothetical protein
MYTCATGFFTALYRLHPFRYVVAVQNFLHGQVTIPLCYNAVLVYE